MRFPDEERLKKGRAAVVRCFDPTCSVCLAACGFSAMWRGEDGLPYSDPAKCVGCGGCAAVCPKRAIRLIKSRGDGTYEITVPYDGKLPELDDMIEIPSFSDNSPVPARVVQAIPKRPRSFSALVRAIAPKEIL
jgi:Fe-S-cluster-containing hydrogenase component 2